MSNPRKRTISQASDGGGGSLPHQVSYLDGSNGLRRRRVDNNNNLEREEEEHNVNTSAKVDTSNGIANQQQQSVVPLSMQMMRPFWAFAQCTDINCVDPRMYHNHNSFNFNEDFFMGNVRRDVRRGGDNSSSTLQRGVRNISLASDMNTAVSMVESAINANNSPKKIDSAIAQKSGASEEVEDSGAMVSFKRATAHNTKQSSYLNNSPAGSSFSEATTSNELPPVPSMSTNNSNTLANINNAVSIEQILNEYTAACTIFGIQNRINPGVLTTLRFSLPTLRVSGNFFDADMLALTEILIKHCNDTLKYIKRLDFTLASKEGKDRGAGGVNSGGGSGKKGIRSHGAYALSKVLSISQYIEEVYLNGNRIGPYGSSAIFQAVSQNSTLRTLLMRGCRIGEKGALVFAKEVCGEKSISGLTEVDLSACRIGFVGCYAIEDALKGRLKSRVASPYQWEDTSNDDKNVLAKKDMIIDLEGNLIFQEVMNCVTHGLGILFGIIGTYALTKQVQHLPLHYRVSCAIYSASVIVLYTSSTLYHSFFALKTTKFIFKVFDRCAIYLLIAGSYTPFLMIALHHEPKWSLHLLLFIWGCAISGILVEAFFQTWKHKSKFSLSMYLGMGWSCLTCMSDMIEVLPNSALALIVAGGLAYTGGVPFFVRNNNLDHSLWHLFVLAGSIFHWLAVYWYVAIPKEVDSAGYTAGVWQNNCT